MMSTIKEALIFFFAISGMGFWAILIAGFIEVYREQKRSRQ